MRQNTLPPFPALLCMFLCMAFVVGLASMGLTCRGVHRQVCVPGKP